MNICMFKGNLTKNPDLRTSQAGKAYTHFSIAVNRPYKNHDGQYEADFVNFIAFEGTAEAIVKYVEIGEPIIVQAEYQSDKYYDTKQGKDVYTSRFIVRNFEFCIPARLKKQTQGGRQNRQAETMQSTDGSGGTEEVMAKVEPEQLPFDL